MKKGFTLIELLAVIVILAIIALIAVPIILGIIENVKIEAAVNSARGYIRSINYKLASDYNKDQENYVGYESINIVKNPLSVDMNGEPPTGRLVEIAENRVSYAELCVNGYSVLYDDGGARHDKDNNYCGTLEEPKGQIINEVCKNNSLYEKSDIFKIKKVEDLVCLSNLVNSGKDFSGKKIILLSDIDFNDPTSYNNKDDKSYKDINGNELEEGILQELTTEKGFIPIGTISNSFSGTFEGYGFTIKNLYINSQSEYIGLFGYNKGTIQGLNLIDVNIASTKSYVGGLVGSNANSGTIKEINISGNVSSDGYTVGGVIGQNSGTVSSVLANINVTGTRTSIGGITGTGDYKGIIEGGSLTGSISSKSSSSRSYVSETVTINGTKYDGKNLGELYVGEPDINGYEVILDTWIGGDDDGNGYYFDYNDDGTDIVVKSVERSPMEFNLKGLGTKEDPYKINNYSDWKTATLNVKDITAYYELANDIDFSKNKFYMLGSSQNYFSGFIDGKGYELKNITMDGSQYLGVSGYNTGTIRGINVTNEIINAGSLNSSHVGGISGMSSGEISGINISTNITGKGSYVGGVVGLNNGTIKDINVNGNVSGGNGFIGGVAGQGGTINSVLANVNVTGTLNNIGGITGSGDYKGIIEGGSLTGSISSKSSLSISYVSETVTINGTKYDGKNLGELYVGEPDINGYEVILDTWIGGDNDGNGYYFDYNDDGTDIVVKSVERYPMEFSLKGLGTKEDPYKINNYSDWKTATLNVKDITAYYELANDIDFSKNKFYMLGSSQNYFSGFIDGKGYELKNITMDGSQYLGVSGYNAGTIRGINVTNEIINAGSLNSSFVGGISGISSGEISGINISTNITGKGNSVGGVVGLNNGTIKDINVNGNVSGGNGFIGGVAGQGGTINSVLANVNVTGTLNNIGGITGGSGYKGVIDGGNLTGTASSNINSILYVSDSATVNGARYTFGNHFLSEYDNDLDYYSTFDILDITDSDNNGYYFDYNSDNSDIIIVRKGESISTDSILVKTNLVDGASDKIPPTCNLIKFGRYGSDGFTATYKCTDNVEVAEKRHIHWETNGENNMEYNQLESTPRSQTSSSIVNSKWTISSSLLEGRTPPTKGVCYYFYFGAKDTSGNTSVYVSKECMSF